MKPNEKAVIIRTFKTGSGSGIAVNRMGALVPALPGFTPLPLSRGTVAPPRQAARPTFISVGAPSGAPGHLLGRPQVTYQISFEIQKTPFRRPLIGFCFVFISFQF